MQQDSVTFWTDIKNYEEQLTKSPESFCFAKLSEIYLAVGLVDDALQTARHGVLHHPDYLAGQRALALACHAKGLTNECLQALQRVTAALPEDTSSQKLLARMYIDNGDQASAINVYRVLSEFEPDDAECRLELDALENLSSTSDTPDSEWDDDEEIIEDLEIVEDDECEADFRADQPDSVPDFQEPVVEAAVPSEPDHDPLSTATVAELYVTQGYLQRALEIYRSILKDDPDNGQVRARIAVLELQALVAVTAAENGAAVSGENGAGESEPEEDETEAELKWNEIQGDAAVSIKASSSESSDSVLSELEICLDNIRRIKACR